MAGQGEVVARWVVRRRRARRQRCEGRRAWFDGVACPACGLMGQTIAVPAMAVVVELDGGARVLAVAERGRGGGWVAVRTTAATPEAVAALRRQDERGGELGGLAGSAA